MTDPTNGGWRPMQLAGVWRRRLVDSQTDIGLVGRREERRRLSEAPASYSAVSG